MTKERIFILEESKMDEAFLFYKVPEEIENSQLDNGNSFTDHLSQSLSRLYNARPPLS